MKQTDKDILKDVAELRRMPYSVPEGYFDTFRREMKKPQTQVVSLWSRIMPYASVAAVFIFLVSAGTFILERTTDTRDFTQEDYILFSENFSLNTIYQVHEETQLADASLADEDIIEYLIYTGVSAEEIEYSK
ncbi:MAG: hypothetical protein J6J54_03165 [Bacteroidales bacterium]|nr:hypothetical protein [Bacteroidales bacterium]